MQGSRSSPAGPQIEDKTEPQGATTEQHGKPKPVAVVDRAPFSAHLGGIADWVIEHLASERVCWTVLGAAMALSVGLCLWLTRGLTFHADDFLYFIASRGFDLHVLLAPHNGHLIFVPRLFYAIVLKLFGARHYVVFRLWEALGIALVAGLFFALAKRRIGAQAALAPSVLLLFLGSAWADSLDPVGATHVYCIAAGLAALLFLDRPSLREDLAACALLLLSVATFSIGLAFLVGAAVSVLVREDRGRRAWIFLLPLALYGVWFVAPKLHTPPFSANTGVTLSNILLIPNYAANAAAAVGAAVGGLAYDFSNPTSFTIDSPWGYLIAALAAAALALRVRRGSLPASLGVSLAILAAYWVSTALVTHLTAEPNQNRYVWDGAVLVLVVAIDAVLGARLSRGALLALYGVTMFSLAGNIALLRVGAGFLRGNASTDRAELAAIEIARDHVDPLYVPQGEPELRFLMGIAGGARSYLAAIDRNGSPAFTLPELRRQPEPVRQIADSTLASALGLHLTPTRAPARGSKCLSTGGRRGAPVDIALRPPGLVLGPTTPATVALRRFAAFPTAMVGDLSAGQYAALVIPRDRAPDQWHLVASGGPLIVCSLGS